MGNGASVTSYAMRFSGANSAAEGFILKIPRVLLEIKSVTSTTSAADSILHARGSAIIDGDLSAGVTPHPRLNATSDYRIKTDVITLTDSLRLII
jgi:hypothetical protein